MSTCELLFRNNMCWHDMSRREKDELLHASRFVFKRHNVVISIIQDVSGISQPGQERSKLVLSPVQYS
jgi:hypothetical protein